MMGKNRLFARLLAAMSLSGVCLSACVHEKPASSPWSSCFDGLSNEGRTADKIYVTAGRKAQIIGLQNGAFPDLGSHVPGEMGGIWAGSFKLADGYWMELSDKAAGTDTLLRAKSMKVYPHCNRFDFGCVLDGLQVTSTQFASDVTPGVIISYIIENRSAQSRDIGLDFLLNVDLSPVWFSQENGICDADDVVGWNPDENMCSAKDSLNDWYMAWGCSRKIDSCDLHSLNPVTQGRVTPTGISTNVRLAAGQTDTVRYFVASSIDGFDKAAENLHALSQNACRQMAEKKEALSSILSYSQIDIPDKEIERAYYWTKINNRWLETDIDTIGLFLSAGAVEYPWLFGCDNSYALQGALCAGNFEIVKPTLRLLNRVSERTNGNGRIIHEMSGNGFVGNKGNTQETAHFIMAVWDAFLWTGDRELLDEIYPNVKKGIAWLTETMDTNHNLFPEGYGIMEVKGLNAELIDVAVYTQQALEASSGMATVMHEEELAAAYKERAEQLKQKINSDFWSEENCSYCDFYATAADAAKVARGAMEQLRQDAGTVNDTLADFYASVLKEAASLPADESRGWFTNKNWVINTPMECGIAPDGRAQAALDCIDAHNCGPYGPYLSAVERKRMMTIATGVQAMAEARYGRIDKAVYFLRMIASTLGRNMPGAINEMMPDYGCPYQAWTLYGLGKVLVSGCFGVWPDAYRKVIRLSPQLPAGWDRISLANLWVGDNLINLEMKKEDGTFVIDYTSVQEGWTVCLDLPCLEGKEIWLNGKVTERDDTAVRIQDASWQLRWEL